MSLFGGSGYQPLPHSHQDYADLSRLESDLLVAAGGTELFEEKLRSFFRSAIDEVVDTARTGRFFLSELAKTEKTYLGTKFEMLLRDWLQVPWGVTLDLLIGGEEVDVKSTTIGKSGWMIPREAIDQLCILLRVDEKNLSAVLDWFERAALIFGPGRIRIRRPAYPLRGQKISGG